MYSIIVTGSGGAVGSAVVHEATLRGWNVISLDLPQYDVTRDSDVVRAVQGIATAENVRAVVHTVGGIEAPGAVTATDAEVVHRMFTLNVYSAFTVLRHTLPLLQRHGGCVVGIAARAVLEPVGGRSAYAAAKSALTSLMLSVASEGRDNGVRANVVVPNIIRTPANMEWASPEESKNWETLEQVATTIMDLCDVHSTVSGHVIPLYREQYEE